MGDERWADLTDHEALVEWLRDGGALDDHPEVLDIDENDASEQVSVGFGGVVVDANLSWVERWRRPTERVRRFRLVAHEVSRCEAPDWTLPSGIGSYDAVQEGGGFGLVLDTSVGCLTLVARRFEAVLEAPVTRDKVWAVDPSAVTFRGSGGLSAADLRGAFAAAGSAVDVYGNWRGSGQAFGATFVAGVDALAPVAAESVLRGAWLLVAAGDAPAPASGVWLTGQSLPSGYYATVTRGSETPSRLWSAALRAMVALPGAEHATSGNVLFDGEAELRDWLDSGALPRV